MRTAQSLVMFALALAAAACVQRVEAPAAAASVGPTLVVEQFMTAVNAQDLKTMGNLMGTKDGPLSKRDPQENVEKRMYPIALILKHDDYKIEGSAIVPGRMNDATQLNVSVTQPSRPPTQVPFILVKARGDQWLIENIDLQKLTARR